MTEPSTPPGLRVAAGPRGRGVFAARAFRAGEVVERAPIVVFPREVVAPLRGTVLDDYWFWWDDDRLALALGLGSLYNHACPASVSFDPDRVARLMVYTAARDVAAGEELTINYHGWPDCPDPVWFEAR
jgi:uncharacterized protein